MESNSGSTGSWDYLDFELEISEGGPRQYPVAVRSPAGEAQAEMHFPFDAWELKDRLQALEIALLRSGGTRRRIASPEENTVQDFGRGLFESLLVGDVRTRYEMSLSEARRQGKGLRLKLRIQASELAALPWEFLYDAERDRYPSLSSNTPLVRYLDLPQPVEPLSVSPPLKVLGMVTSPSGLAPLDVEHEKRLVEEAVRGLREQGLLELTWLEGQTWRHLQRTMRHGPWHVFHFVGHGGFDPATEEGALALSDDAGHMRLLRASGLAELLDDHYPLRLVFLNSCEGARGSESDAFSSTAATLVRRGVPAVVAMQYEITDQAAIEFSRDFYEALADSLPVDAAVTEARAAVSMDSALEWGTPVLYMHSPDGRVFDVVASAQRPQQVPETEDQQEQDAVRRYREAVGAAWVGGILEAGAPQRLRDLVANDDVLSPETAAHIEREVMGDTMETILDRQEEAARQEQRDRRLADMYAEAGRLHRDRRWQAVIELFEKMHAEDPGHPDPEGLLASSRDALEQEQRVATVVVPDLTGLKISRARRILTGRRLMIGSQHDVPSESLADGEIVTQNPEPGTQVVAGSPVDITVSSGSQGTTAADPTYYDAGEHAYRVESAQPALPASVGSWWALVLRGVIVAVLGLGLLVAFQADSERFRLFAIALLLAEWVLATIDAKTSTGRRELLLTQGRISGLLGLFALLFWLVRDQLILSSIDERIGQAIAEFPVARRLVGAWAVMVGTIRVFAAMKLRPENSNVLLMGASGVLLVASGILLWFEGLSLSPLLGASFLFSGAALMAVALLVRRG